MNLEIVTFEEYKTLGGDMHRHYFEHTLRVQYPTEKWDEAKQRLLRAGVGLLNGQATDLVVKLSYTNPDRNIAWLVKEASLMLKKGHP